MILFYQNLKYTLMYIFLYKTTILYPASIDELKLEKLISWTPFPVTMMS